MSAAIHYALSLYRDIRAEFEDYRTAAYTLAADECRGALLNGRGLRKGIDAFDLFIGPEVRARAYASPELLDHWTRHPRMTYAEYERQALPTHLYAAALAA